MLINRVSKIPNPKDQVPGRMIYSDELKRMLISDGTGWINLGDPLVRCVICDEVEPVHKAYPKNYDHPYCRSNLEMLEWKYEQSQKM